MPMPSSKSHRREYMREYRQKNLDRILQVNREYYWTHREKMLAYGKAYREKMKAQMTEEDIEERRAYQRLLYQIRKESKKKKDESEV